MKFKGKIGQVLLHLIILLGLSACSPDDGPKVKECFFKASLTKANYSKENYELFRSVGIESAYAYAYDDGEVAYFPFATGYSFYFGGTCAQAIFWKEKIQGRLKIEDISKEKYWRDYKANNEETGIISFGEPEDQ